MHQILEQMSGWCRKAAPPAPSNPAGGGTNSVGGGSPGTPADSVVVQGDFRPRIEIPGPDREGRDFAQEMGLHLRKHNVYNRSGIAVVMNKKGGLEPMDPSAFITWAQDHVCVVGWVGSGENRRLAPVDMTEALSSKVLKSPQFLNQLREVRRVNKVPQPVWRSDGIPDLLRPGYDEEHGVLTLPGVTFAEDMDSARAIEVLTHWTGGFGFDPVDPIRSRAVLLSAMFGVFCDLMLPAAAVRPGFLNTGNIAGSGKTLGVRLAVCPVHGSLEITSPPKGEDSEMQKILATVALNGDPYLCLDNWRGKIESVALEGFMTSRTYGGRILGVSKKFVVEKECMVFITANGAIVNDDMRRRLLRCDLFVEEAVSEDRVVPWAMDEEVILKGRSEILAALWSIVRFWFHEGEGGGKDGTIINSNFPEWSRVIGGIVECLGYGHPCAKPVKEINNDLTDFIRLLAEAMAPSELGSIVLERTLEPSELIIIARKVGAFEWFLDSDEPQSEKEARSQRAQFGRKCERYANQVLGGFKFKSEGKGHGRRYHIERAATGGGV